VPEAATGAGRAGDVIRWTRDGIIKKEKQEESIRTCDRKNELYFIWDFYRVGNQMYTLNCSQEYITMSKVLPHLPTLAFNRIHQKQTLILPLSLTFTVIAIIALWFVFTGLGVIGSAG
jgi:hypothetical protein